MFTKKHGEKEKQRDRACTLLEEVRLVRNAPEGLRRTALK